MDACSLCEEWPVSTPSQNLTFEKSVVELMEMGSPWADGEDNGF